MMTNHSNTCWIFLLILTPLLSGCLGRGLRRPEQTKDLSEMADLGPKVGIPEKFQHQPPAPSRSHYAQRVNPHQKIKKYPRPPSQIAKKPGFSIIGPKKKIVGHVPQLPNLKTLAHAPDTPGVAIEKPKGAKLPVPPSKKSHQPIAQLVQPYNPKQLPPPPPVPPPSKAPMRVTSFNETRKVKLPPAPPINNFDGTTPKQITPEFPPPVAAKKPNVQSPIVKAQKVRIPVPRMGPPRAVNWDQKPTIFPPKGRSPELPTPVPPKSLVAAKIREKNTSFPPPPPPPAPPGQAPREINNNQTEIPPDETPSSKDSLSETQEPPTKRLIPRPLPITRLQLKPKTKAGLAGSINRVYQLAQDSYASIDSYIVRFRRREVVNGRKRPEELILFKFRKDPWSVYLKWLGEEGKGREVLFVRGKYQNKIHTLTATGDIPLIPGGNRMALDPDSGLVRSKSRHSITEAGIGKIIEAFGKVVDANARGDFSRGRLKYLGKVQRSEFEEPVEAVINIIPANGEKTLPKGGKRFIYFDTKLRFPVLIVTLDHNGREVEYYCYDRFLFPGRLSEDEFNPDKLWGQQEE